MRTQDLDLGFLAEPGSGPRPGVVMIHDVWGLADHTRDLAQRLAAEGFGVLAVDLYLALGPVEIEDPGRFIRALSDPEVLADLQAAVDSLAAHPACAGQKVGMAGFCMGGMYALLAACSVRGLGACASFYGMLSYEHGLLHDEAGLDPARKPRQPLDAVPDLGCPLLACFGDSDDFIPQSDVECLRERLAGTGERHEVVVYPGAGHAFMNDTRPAVYRPEAAADAWTRLVHFLREHLG